MIDWIITYSKWINIIALKKYVNSNVRDDINFVKFNLQKNLPENPIP